MCYLCIVVKSYLGILQVRVILNVNTKISFFKIFKLKFMNQKKISKNLFLLITAFFLTLSFYSCKKDQSPVENIDTKLEQKSTDLPSVDNGRLVFKSHEDYYNFIELMENGDFSKIKQFENNTNFSSLFSVLQSKFTEETLPQYLQDYENIGLPQSFQRVLNKDAEVVIGNEIIWYSKDKKYFIENHDEKKLAEVKANLDRSIVKQVKVGNEVLPVKAHPTTSPQRIWLGLSNYTASWQLQFWQYAPWAGWRKYVHGLEAYTDGVFIGNVFIWHSYLYLNIKMESKGKRWTPSGEIRDISYNITCDNKFWGPAYFAYILPQNTIYNATVTQAGDIKKLIGHTQGSGTFGPDHGWNPEISGTIYQHVVGDVQGNQWYNTAYPLW
jgi:hypothetical protein